MFVALLAANVSIYGSVPEVPYISRLIGVASGKYFQYPFQSNPISQTSK
jgi:hypothetical protein